MRAERNTDIIIFESKDGLAQLEVTTDYDTVWVSKEQMAALFQRDRSVISRHVNNIFKEDEVERETNVQKMHIANSDKPVKSYSLDVIISVGYRVKSQQGTRFRQWATKLLNQHLTQGYTLNQQRFEENAKELEAALTLIRKTAASADLITDTGRGLVEIVSRYTQTFLWLQRYDEGLLNEPQGQPGGTTVFNQMGASFEIVDGVLRNDNLNMLLENYRTTGKGRVGLGARDIDYTFVPTALRARSGKGLAIPVRIRGPWANPKILPDLGAAIDLNLAEEKAKIEEKARDAVKNKIEQELGVVTEEGQSVEDAVKEKVEDKLKKELLKIFD